MVTVRRMVPHDLPAVTSIHRSILREAIGDVGDIEVEQEFFDLIEKYPEGCLVAEESGQVVGFIVGTLKHWGFGLGVSGWIEIVGVHPERMGTGVGKALGSAILEHFRAEGITDIHTAVRWDSGDLITFFKSIGFNKSDFINLKCTQGESK